MPNSDEYRYIDTLIARIKSLENENAKLKQILRDNGISIPDDSCGTPSAMRRLSPQEKIDLFSNLFRGRTDVFARRWCSTLTGKSGYQPVCSNEWVSGLCDKKKQKCADCPNREFEPLTSEHLYRHLEGKDTQGRDVIGIYPVLEDNICYFLCADFDDKSCEHDYQEDVKAYVDVCDEWDIPVSVERSRSGNGAHVWLFFEEPITTYKARRLGCAILTEAMQRNGRK